jgi:ubiquinone/menaquinone biosynthesis C-methylase UbiE/uncharacterized protein YbaR (Trm112 family)
MTPRDVAALACPVCLGVLRFEGALDGGRLGSGALACETCDRPWPVRNGLPDLVDESRVRTFDRVMRVVYDWIAPLHDPATRVLLPLLQGSSEDSTREGSVRRLRLDELRGEGGRPPKILEVGIGSGGSLPWIERALPRGLDEEVWGVDLSPEMLARCDRHVAGRPVRLLLADGHALPFPDASFDRVYNAGGIGTYGDPARGLAEMARVARPGAPIVVVDEQLDPRAGLGIFRRLAFRALTLYELAPRCPTAHLPPNAVDVTEEQVSPFYYCLSFRRPDLR